MDLLTVTPDLWLQNETGCLEYLNNHLHWNSVPLLNANNLQDLQDGKLVRFSGMVQDMFNPEYFYEKYEVVDENSMERLVRNGKFIDINTCKDTEIFDYASSNNITSERQTLVVISVPGLNEWVENIEKDRYKLQQILPKSHNVNLNNEFKKRTLESDEDMETQPAIDSQTSAIHDNKKQCVIPNPPTSNTVVSQEHLLNFPLPERSGKTCHVKMYKESETIKLNDMVDVVGFLSVDPILTNVGCHDEYDSEMEIQTHNPPPSLIPRIHCVMWKRIEHNNPLIDEINLSAKKIQCLKKDLHMILTQLLMGDAMVAEYFIYYLISRIYLRNELLPLGKFTLNISHIPDATVPDYGKQLYEFIELLIPKSHYLPMTLENMNDIAFTPKKDYECDRVTSGLLQLSNNTHLVLDETKLTPGRLNESGVKAVGALSATIKTQKTTYDFNYFPMEFDCDIPFLILSEGKSLLPSDFHVPLKPDKVCVNTFNEIIEAAKHFLKPELLNELRVYLTMTKHGNYELADNMQELVQNEFVRMRQAKTVTPDDLHQLLVLARLVCLSEGKTSLDGGCWKRACDLEEERKRRL